MKESRIIKIDVTNIPKVGDRLEKVSGELDKTESGEYAEKIAGDERMVKPAPKIVASIEKAEFIGSWKGEDGFYHTTIRKKRG
jgi:hypothetical protein